MKVSVDQLAALIRASIFVYGTNELTEDETNFIIVFLKGFRLSDEMQTKVINRAIELSGYDETIRLLRTITDEASRQECSNQLFHCVMTETDVCDETFNTFKKILDDCDFPRPNSEEWELLMATVKNNTDSLLSNDDDEMLSNESADEKYFFLIRDDGCCVPQNISDFSNFRDPEELATHVLNCTEGVLFEFQNSPILKAIYNRLQSMLPANGSLRAYICKRPSGGKENVIASEILGKTIYGHMLIFACGMTGVKEPISEYTWKRIYQSLQCDLKSNGQLSVHYNF